MRATCSAALFAVTVVGATSVGAQTADVQLPAPAAPPTTQTPAPPVQAPPIQAPPAPAGDSQTLTAGRGRTPSSDARFKVRVMEGVLERAVEHAATVMNGQLRAVSPDLVLLTGAARARGYRLDGYGLFFDVQVPAALRQSMGWTVRMMRQNNESVEQALTLFKRMVGSLQGKARDDAEIALRNIELEVRPGLGQGNAPANVPPLFSVTPPAQPVAAASMPTSESAPTPVAEGAPTPAPAPVPEDQTPRTPINPLVVQNPDLAYELEVREALIGAMVEWGATLPLQADEWFTVAARDNQDVVIPGEAAEVVTIIMRVRGSDLADFRAGRLSAADVRKRVEVREF